MSESQHVPRRMSFARFTAPWESSLRPSPEEVESALLTYVRKRLGDNGIEYARPPAIAGDGVGARVFSFRLKGAPPEYSGPLVLKLALGTIGQDRTPVESAVQNALAELGGPVPRVLMAGGSDEGLAGSFLIMEQVEGWNFMLALAAALAVALGLAAIGVSAGLLALCFGALYLGVMLRTLLRLHDLPADEFLAEVEEAGVAAKWVSIDDELGGLEERAEARGLSGLREALGWLRENRPADGESPVVCHGDYWPGNLMVTRRGRLALIDWAAMRVAPREFELAYLKIQPYSGLPFAGPGPLWVQDGVEWLVRSMAWVGVGATRRLYQFFRPLDPGAMRYFEVLHCLRLLVYTEEGRALARERGDPPPFNPWASPDTISLLERSVRTITGRRIRLPS